MVISFLLWIALALSRYGGSNDVDEASLFPFVFGHKQFVTAVNDALLY